MGSVMNHVEKRLGLIVNRPKSRRGKLAETTFLGFQISARGKVEWSAKALERFKQRVREITRRNRGQNVQFVINELRRYATGWMNYFGISHTYAMVLELDEWMRRRLRLYHWKQWTRSAAERASRQAARRAERSGGNRPGTRRRHLIRLGIDPGGVHRASRSRKGYGRMSQN